MPGIISEPDDLCLYVTEACNSNCVMCPMSNDSRRRGKSLSLEEWEKIIDTITEETDHITITGGEPFLCYQKLIPVIRQIHSRFPHLPILILTNGRAMSLPMIQQEMKGAFSSKDHYAIPIHSNQSELHDTITQSKGSFEQTWQGIRFLSGTDAKIEIRIVGHRLNLESLNDTFRYISDSGCHISLINLVAMEMTGNAARNRKNLWVNYRDIYDHSRDGIHYAVEHGIDVGLYNFPLCVLPREAWPLSKNSITEWKIRYEEACRTCDVREACGGLFYSVQELKLCQISPVKEYGIR